MLPEAAASAYAGSLSAGSPEPLFSVTPSGRILTWTRRAERAYGYSRAEAIGRLLVTVAVPPESVDELQRALAEALAAGRAECRAPGRRKDGTLLPALGLTLVRHGEGADASIVFLTGRDAVAARIAPVTLAPAAPPEPEPVPLAAAPAPAALAALRDALRADVAALLVPGASGLECVVADAEPGVDAHLPGAGLAALLDADGPEEVRASGLLAVAVILEGRRVAVLQALSRTPRDWSAADARILRLAAQMVPLTQSLPRDPPPLALLAHRLAGCHSADGLARTLVEALVPSWADWAAVDLLEADGRTRRAAAAHRDPRLADELMRLPQRSASAPANSDDAIRLATAVVSPEPPEAGDEALATVGAGPHLVLPLRGRMRTLGALTLVRTGGWRFAQADIDAAHALARGVAIEIDNALLVGELGRARDDARGAGERARLLLELSAALSDALTPSEVTAVVIGQAREALGALGGAIAILTPDHAGFELVGAVGEAEPLHAALVRFPVHASLPLADAARSGDAIVFEHALAGAPRYPYLAHAGPRAPRGALLAIPLMVDGRLMGALGLCWAERRRFTPDELEFARHLARHAGDALERARLYGSERSARALADAEARRSALLADASRLLASSFDYRTTLESAARLLVPHLADWCAVFLREKGGDVRAVAAVHADATKAHLARALLALPGLPEDDPGSLGQVLRTGRPATFNDVPDAAATTFAAQTEMLRVLRQMGLRTQALLPLTARGRTLGVLVLGSALPRTPSPADVQLTEELSRRIALAVDNARLYHEVEEAYRRREEIIAALRESEERYRLLVDAVADHAIFLLDRDGRVESWNPGAQRLLGHDATEARGLPLAAFYPEEARAAGDPARHLADAATHGRHEEEGWRVRKDGTLCWANVVVTALHDGEGSLRGFAVIHRDLTERKAEREELDLARARLAASEKLSTMGTLVSGVAHEIRTPLTAIANSVSLIQMHLDRGRTDPEVLRRHASMAIEGVDRINALVQDLRRFHRGRPVGRERASLDDVVDEALRLFRAAHRGRVDLATRLEPTPPCEVDRAQVQQAVLNLLQNAAEAMPHGGRIVVETSAGAGTGGAAIVIRDEGEGMTEEVRARMFEEFYTTKPQGTGLGLSIVRRILEVHGGRIDCESEPGKGTTFVLTLPCVQGAAAARSQPPKG